MIPKIQTNLGRFSDAELVKKADYIVTSMIRNPAFPDTVPAISEVQAAFVKFSSDLIAASGRDTVLVAEKNKSRKNLSSLLSRLGLHIMCVAHGDAATLAGSGYPMVKTREPGYITNPESITVKNGASNGQLVCRVKPVKHASMYMHEITTDFPNVDAAWTTTRSSKSHHVFASLEPGKKYWFRVAAVRGNEVAYSQVASWYVQ